jgi:hypothetical protein
MPQNSSEAYGKWPGVWIVGNTTHNTGQKTIRFLLRQEREKLSANERVFCLAAVWAKEEPKKSDENGPRPLLIQTYALRLLD